MSADILTRMREHVNKHRARERAMFTVAGVTDLLAHIESLEARIEAMRADAEEMGREYFQFRQAVTDLFGVDGLRAAIKHAAIKHDAASEATR